MLSLFVLLKMDLILQLNIPSAVVFVLFNAYIMTGKSNIDDLYLWKCGEPSKYEDVINFVKYNQNNSTLLEFENKIKNRSNLDYLIYKYKFKEGKSFKDIKEILDLDNPRIVEHLDKISFAISLYCEI